MQILALFPYIKSFMVKHVMFHRNSSNWIKKSVGTNFASVVLYLAYGQNNALPVILMS